jgi:hypothetical protein
MAKHRSHIVRFSEEFRRSKDRRGAPRYSPSVAVEACLSWMEGTEYQYAKAEIIDVSMTGLHLRVAEIHPKKGTVWVRLEPPNPADWVEADVVEGSRGEPTSVRVHFRVSCPYDMFKAAVNGFAHKPGQGFMTLPNDLKNPQYW